MIAANLLAMNSTMKIVVIVASVFAGLAALYGVFRKFSRMSWGGWQLLVLFALFLLFGVIPVPEGPNGYAIIVGLGFALIALVLGASLAVRGVIRSRTKPVPVVLRVFDRIFGAVTGILDIAVLLLVLGGFVLAVCEQLPFDSLSALDVVYDSAIWQKIGGFAADFLLIAVLTYAVKGGYRLGFGRFLWAGMTILLSFVAVFGAIYLVIKVPFLIAFSKTCAGIFHINAIAARICGIGLASLVVFLVFFTVIVLLNVFINFIFKKVNRSRTLNFISGFLMAVLFYVFVVALITVAEFGIAYLVSYISALDEENMLAAAAPYLEMLETILSAPKIGGLLYTCNPLRALIPLASA